jgi:hypothetical protein
MTEVTSWREAWTAADVEKALAYAGLTGWRFDNWSDGDMQFMHTGPVAFDDLAKLRITFTPLRMVVEAVVDAEADEALLTWKQAGSQPLAIPVIVLVTLSWNAVSNPEAV